MVKVKAFILLESMIAMIIISLCLGMSLSVFNTVISGNRSQLRVLARVRMQSEAAASISADELIDEEIPGEQFTMDKTVTPYKETGHLYCLKIISRTPDGVFIGEYNELFLHP